MDNRKVKGLDYSKCLWCGKTNTTKHHVIPRRYKPKENIIVPLCEEHHRLIDNLIPDVENTYINKLRSYIILEKKVTIKKQEYKTLVNRYCELNNKVDKKGVSTKYLKVATQRLTAQLNYIRKQRDEYESILMERRKDREIKKKLTMNCRM